MRNWTIPGQWTPTNEVSKQNADVTADKEIPFSPMRRQPLRKSGGFLQIENIFAEVDQELSATSR